MQQRDAAKWIIPSEGNKNLMNKKGATKHCSWGLYNMDSRYPEQMKRVFFITFAKPGCLKDTMSDWERQQNLKKTEKAKRWLHACGRKDFNRTEQIKKDTYICSLHFVGQKGPTEEHPDPVKAGDEGFFERRKRKPPKQRLPLQKKKTKKDEFDIACYSGNVSSSNENTLLTTDTTDNDETDNSIISNTEILFEKRDTDSLNKKEIFDNNSMERKHWKKQHRLATSTVLGLKQRK